MPLNPAKVALAVQGGYSIYCATCTKYWDYKDKGASNCGAKDGCKGPLFGGSFHEYDGPITEHARQCFACGQASRYILTGGKRDFGVCSNHVAMFEGDKYLVDSKSREVIPASSLARRPKKSLIQEIMKVEEYYAKKAGIL